MPQENENIMVRRSRYVAPFISFEGGDGSGKTTQAKRLMKKLGTEGYDAILVREPGSTELGEQIREIIKSPNRNVPAADALLFMAARAQLMHDIILPHLKKGTIVIADRFTDSTLAYQGFGGKLDRFRLEHANELAVGTEAPDLTIFLDLNPEVGLRRRHAADASQDYEHHRFEDLPIKFHWQVRKGYRTLAEETPGRWIKIDGSAALDEVAQQIWEQVAMFLRLK